MKKRERGILSVEASIVLTLMLLFILFLFSFGRVYRAQNLVGHATLQSADAIAMESYLRETALQTDTADVVYLANQITDSSAISTESLESLRSADLAKIARQKFVSAIANSEAKADEKLKSMGVKDGLAGIDFTECKMDLGNDDVIIAVTYTIKMQFPVFGYEEITVTKAAKAKTFGEILFEVSTKPNNPDWGSTSGDDKVVHGSTVQISATPKYGYKFVSWNDGNKENPRTVTVMSAQHYTAIFEKDSFGINISKKIDYNQAYKGIEHTSYGSFEGAGNYQYLDDAVLKAIPSEPNYEFKGWDINGDGVIDNKNKTITIKVDKTYDKIKAVFQPATCMITVKANNSSYGTAIVQQGSQKGTSIKVEYGSKVQLVAAIKDGTVYRFENWSNGSTLLLQNIVIRGSEEYIANFVHNTYKVTFYNETNKFYETEVICNSSINGSKNIISSSMPSSNPTKSGVLFANWTYNGTVFNSNTIIKNNIDVYALWNCTVTLNANGGVINGVASASHIVLMGQNFNFDNYKPTRNGYIFAGWYVGDTRYQGNNNISSNITATAKWDCAHPNRYIEKSTGNVCAGGTHYYKCSQCGVDRGTATYAATRSHSYTYRCNVKHALNYFNGRASGGCWGYHKKNTYCDTCGVTHGNKVYGYCIVCKWCYNAKPGVLWCGQSHAGNSRRTAVTPIYSERH